MPKGLKHTQETKDKISIAAKRTMKQSNAGFKQRIACESCGQEMSPANMGRHYKRCVETRGIILNGNQLSVKEIKALGVVLKASNWSVSEYIQAHTEQDGRCFICNSPPGKGRNRLDADHCHETSSPRKLLCSRCNFGIGLFKDNTDLMLKAIQYIQSHADQISH